MNCRMALLANGLSTPAFQCNQEMQPRKQRELVFTRAYVSFARGSIVSKRGSRKAIRREYSAPTV
jgi:hypothetical protein